jgi:hypothetical protein
MPHPLDGIEKKIERAMKHVEQFCRDAAKFEREAYSVRIEPDAKAGILNLFTVDMGLGDPPVQLRLLAGEIAYQLRSSLDHIIYILAKQTPERNRQFPIYMELQKYESRAYRIINGVSPRAEAIIKNAQPFQSNTPQKHPLQMLDELSNTDKHRVIPACFVYTDVMSIDFVGGPYYSIQFGPDRRLAKDSTKIGSVPIPLGYTPEMKMDSESIFTIAFTEIGDAKLEPVIPLLHQWLCFVESLVNDFRSEF